ncbi:MAG: ArsR/SmtB family transcription factor [Actinomycetota bacterium]
MPKAMTAPVRKAGETEALSRYFRVLGDPTRLRILEALLERERTVSELVQLVGAPQSRVSNHLACLKWCRVAESERRGRNVVYRVTDPRIRGFLKDAGELAAEHCDHLASCRRIGPDWI